jgi:hypothetical protein
MHEKDISPNMNFFFQHRNYKFNPQWDLDTGGYKEKTQTYGINRKNNGKKNL